MNDILNSILSMSISSGLIALIIVGLLALFKKYFTKSWCYYVWIIILIRLMIPYVPKINIPDKLDYKNFITEITNSEDKTPISLIDAQEIEKRSVEKRVDKVLIAFVVWLSIAMYIFVSKILDYIRFINDIKVDREEIDDSDYEQIINSITNKFNIKSIKVYESNNINTPMLIGLFKPYIILPKVHFDNEKLKYILMHELMHMKRKDILYKWIMQLVVCIHWFNPVVYYIAKEIEKYCELSCDERVFAYLSIHERIAYGDTLIYSIKATKSLQNEKKPCVSFSRDYKAIKMRLEEITKYKRLDKKKYIASICIAVILASSTSLIGVHTAKASKNIISNENITRLNIDKIAIKTAKLTGNANYIRPYFKFMTNEGLDEIQDILLEKNRNQFFFLPTIDKYTEINMTYTSLVDEIITETNDIYSCLVLFEYLEKKQVEDIVAKYMERTKEYYKLPDLYHLLSDTAIKKISNGGVNNE
ncbi:M56 family metallopeptidase [Clostridiaceae bacterium M8S5]|nr:M56 family metallopeptidase [Clostridiaceae bacterium M8S5]